jgi:hypothetical protein
VMVTWLISGASEIRNCLINSNFEIENTQLINLKESITLRGSVIDTFTNRYFCYGNSILVKDSMGKEKIITVQSPKGSLSSSALRLSANKELVYVYSNYTGELGDDGICLSTISTRNHELKATKAYAFPPELIKQVYDLGYGTRKKDLYSLERYTNTLIELADGTISFCGHLLSFRVKSMGGDVGYFEGPILSVFIKPNTSELSYALIPKQFTSSGSGMIADSYRSNLVVLYVADEKSMKTDRMLTFSNLDETTLFAAVFSSEGKLISKNKLADEPSGKYHFALPYWIYVGPHKFRIPEIKRKTFKEVIYKWVEIDVR